MVKFLNRQSINEHIDGIIEDAKTYLFLITPYLQLSQKIKDLMAGADSRQIAITIVYRNQKLSTSDKEFLFGLANASIYLCETLHSKCYFNDDSMIIGSMNLYEFSQLNNREMGVLINSNIDVQLFNEALEEVNSIIKNDSKLQITISQIENSSGIVLEHPLNNQVDKRSAVINSLYHKYDFSLSKSLSFSINDFEPDNSLIELVTGYSTPIIRVTFNFSTNCAIAFHEELVHFNHKAVELMKKFSGSEISFLNLQKPMQIMIRLDNNSEWVLLAMVQQTIKHAIETLIDAQTYKHAQLSR